MRNLRFKLPPLNSLVIFEAAARHLSFTLAGEELRISREAVSRQIKALETYIDEELTTLISDIDGSEAAPTTAFQRVIQRAAIHVQSSGRTEVTGANVLVGASHSTSHHMIHHCLGVHDHRILGTGSHVLKELSKRCVPAIDHKFKRVSQCSCGSFISNIGEESDMLLQDVHDDSRLCQKLFHGETQLRESLGKGIVGGSNEDSFPVSREGCIDRKME